MAADPKMVRAAAIQMTSSVSVPSNLRTAAQLLRAAADDGAALAVLPENFSFLGATDAERIAAAEAPGSGPAQDFLVEQAEALGLWIVGGTIPILVERDRAASRSLLVAPDGRVTAAYDKIHLFDVDVPENPGESYRESATTVPGESAVVAHTPFASIGMAVCYDIRFPALLDRLGSLGMELLTVPAAFTVPTGRVHWETLLRARAIESLSYVVASAQWGEHAGGRMTYGHSLIVDPWGEVVAQIDSGAGIASADLDMMRLADIRRQFPALSHRREIGS